MRDSKKLQSLLNPLNFNDKMQECSSFLEPITVINSEPTHTSEQLVVCHKLSRNQGIVDIP